MYKWIYFFVIASLSFSQTPKEKAKDFIENKQFNKAENELLVFCASNPKDIEAIELLGDTYGYQKKWDEAIKYYKALIKKQPKNANYHYKYGGVLGMKALSINKFRALGIIGDIKRAFLKAAELDSRHLEARWALVELYVSLPGIVGGSNSKALKYANQLEKLSKHDGYLAKGYIYEYDDKPELAKMYYLKAITISNAINCETALKKEVHNKRNALHYQIGKVSADYKLRLDKGEKCLKLYLANHSVKDGVPKAWAYYRLAQVYKHKGNKAKALKWIHKAIAGLPKIKIFKEEKVIISKL